MTANAKLHNEALQLTANPLRGLTAAELGRYVAGRVIEASVTHTPEFPTEDTLTRSGTAQCQTSIS
jgi:hypothetical protein